MHKRIKSARERTGLTQKELAEKLGISQSTMQRYETGKEKITVDALVKLSEITKEDINWIVYGNAKEMSIDTKTAQLIKKMEGEDATTVREIIEMAETIMIKNQAKRIVG